MAARVLQKGANGLNQVKNKARTKGQVVDVIRFGYFVGGQSFLFMFMPCLLKETRECAASWSLLAVADANM